jgi:hypothetical protein
MEGDNLVNGWPQKHAGDLLGEAIIALALSGLRQRHDEAGAVTCRRGVQCWLWCATPLARAHTRQAPTLIQSLVPAARSLHTGNAHDSHSDAFVHTHRVGVCRGPYPPAFIKAWRAWDKTNTSENDFIGGLPPDQLYAVFAMANCGRDLEGYQLAGYDQARSMLLQVCGLCGVLCGWPFVCGGHLGVQLNLCAS